MNEPQDIEIASEQTSHSLMLPGQNLPTNSM